MEGLFACLCVVGMVWAGMALIGAIFGRRSRGYGYGPGYGGGWGGGIGSFRGGMGLGWLVGNMWSGDQSASNDMLNTGDEPQYIDHANNDGDWGNSDGGDWGGGDSGGDWGGGDSGGDIL
ncbi:MAG: hypothetical protein ACK46D_19020 [Roseiflexaceae bacterium]|jgi:hypothetical protein